MQRGHNGTTATEHLADDLVYVAPQYSPASILDAINIELNDLTGEIPAIKHVEFTNIGITDTANDHSLPSNLTCTGSEGYDHRELHTYLKRLPRRDGGTRHQELHAGFRARLAREARIALDLATGEAGNGKAGQEGQQAGNVDGISTHGIANLRPAKPAEQVIKCAGSRFVSPLSGNPFPRAPPLNVSCPLPAARKTGVTASQRPRFRL